MRAACQAGAASGSAPACHDARSMLRPAPLLAAAVLAVAALAAGCGGRSADLFGVARAGSVPDARLRIVVNDGGTVSCDGGGDRRLPADLLVQARELQRDHEQP